jgi:hypothetical protein
METQGKRLPPKSTSFKVIELNFLTYLFIVATPWSFIQEVKVPK